MWKQECLYQYTSESCPYFSFYYLPISKREQRKIWQAYKEANLPTYELLLALIRERVVIMQEDIGVTVYNYTWPRDEDMQGYLLLRIPHHLQLELGAAILGKMRARGEDMDMFIERIKTDPHDLEI